MGLAVELGRGSHDPQTNVTNDDPVMTGHITPAHLKEIPDYYDRLEKMEKEASIASAHGLFGGDNSTQEERVSHQQEMFEHHADLLGISIDEVKAAWSEGKRLPEIAEEQGISKEDLQEKMHALHLEEAEERLSELVSQGVITQEQADSRLSFMKERSESPDFERGPGRGFGHHRGGDRSR